jgi:hypothetical protein
MSKLVTQLNATTFSGASVRTWTASPIDVGGEMMRVFCHVDRLVVVTNRMFTALQGGDERADGGSS